MGIDLNSLVPSLVDLGYSLAEQIVSSGSYVHSASQAYNPSTGASGSTNQTDVVDLIRSPVDKKLINGDTVRVGDERFVIRTTEFVNVAEHSTDDKITVGSDVWEVVEIRKDPTGSVLILHVRKIGV